RRPPQPTGGRHRRHHAAAAGDFSGGSVADISPKDTQTPVESPIPVPPSSSKGSSSPVRLTTPDYHFDESIFAELDNSLWIISRPLENKPIHKESNKLDAC
nr:hypothetical protein [Tanacetum cinerariifolium]